MSVLTLQPTPKIQFKAVATSLGFTEAEARYYVGLQSQLSPKDLELIRSALERGFYYLANVECEGSA